MLKITIFTALLIVLTASALNKEGGGSKNIRKLLDETNADKTSFATRNLERNGIESKENLVNGYQVGSYSSSSMQDRLQKEEKEGRYKFESEYSSDEQKFENSNQQSNAFEEEVKAQPILKNSVESSLLQLDEMISKVNPGLKASKRSFGETDMIDGDIKLDKDSAADLVQFYKRNPGYLRLDSNETDTPASNTFDTRKVLKDRKWRFPIKYRIQLAFSGNRELVRKAVRIWQRETCVSFRETETIKSSGINFKENKQG
ncbi:uncharacterized protein LOC134235993 [Saccostrea cucullata]|uniref:uncharacterized protein LOC134235993 n=1 Tax=Saccostrea cuccullata TaxID=36930 RepID=UPI002ED1B428